jgi:hypothetical protein
LSSELQVRILCSAGAVCSLLAASLSLRRPPAPARKARLRSADTFEAVFAQRLPPSEVERLAPRFNGVWLKDDKASDSLAKPMDLIHMPFLLRKAVFLIVGLELNLSRDAFLFTVTSRIRWFKIHELYSTDSLQPRRLQRRDLRGSAYGRCAVTDRGVELSVQWDEPHAGRERSTLSVSEDGSVLTAQSRIELVKTGESVSYKTVYRRQVAH